MNVGAVVGAAVGLSDYTLRNVTVGAALLGLVSGVLGCYAVLRRQSLLGDALSHAALPGICLAYLITGSKAPLALLGGAAVAGWLGAALLLAVVRTTVLDEDAALGTVISTFFGAGLVLLTLIARRRGADQAGLDSYLFGQAATLVTRDVVAMAVLGAVALAVTALCAKELELTTFDPAFADSLGFRTTTVSVLLTTLLVVAIVIGLQTVGVVLMAALLIGPAVAARQWTHQLGRMLVVAGIVGATSGTTGAVISVTQTRLSTGPTVILVLSVAVALSLAFAPARGLAWEARRRRRAAAPGEGGRPR